MRLRPLRVPSLFSLLLLAIFATTGVASCKPRSIAEAEAKRDVGWLDSDGTPQAIAALGRLADSDAGAEAVLQRRAALDVHPYLAAWEATLRAVPWGPKLLRAGLSDPTRADAAASAMLRGNPALAQFAPDLESAVVRLSGGQRGAIIAGVLASIGPPAHAQVERRLTDPKTRGIMCDGLGLPDASGDAKSLVLSVPPEVRDHVSCVSVVLALAATEDIVVEWLASTAEPGLLSAAAKGSVPCSRLAVVWSKGLVARPVESHGALSVPLQLTIRRCALALDPVLADLLAKAPRARPCILQAIDPYSADLKDLKLSCKALEAGWVAGETRRVRERVADARAHGCAYSR